ncbi:MAG: ethanolamine ammonia-lyase reactivating factor EutA [Flavobacteriales bacterium]|nr:ethanolamine ammonia-lyase reactivating factor EutA [Flavobacteriales bacterium]
MTKMRYAAVDIGSNAVRLLFCDVDVYQNHKEVKKISLIRLPIRLGQDVFTKKKISNKNINNLIKALESFKNLASIYDVVAYRVCATSAMREAKNGKEVIDKIKKKTKIEIEIIDGDTEAKLILETHVTDKLDPTGTFLYIDVGGGSTELSIYSKGEQIQSKSFKIGTIRLKNDLVTEKTWKEMQSWIVKAIKKHQPEMAIGTGGNINKLYKMCGLKDYKLFGFSQLNDMNNLLLEHTIEERILKLGLKPDRADVITHAARIYLTVLKTAKIENIFVPKVGLADGIIYKLSEASY